MAAHGAFVDHMKLVLVLALQPGKIRNAATSRAGMAPRVASIQRSRAKRYSHPLHRSIRGHDQLHLAAHCGADSLGWTLVRQHGRGICLHLVPPRRVCTMHGHRL